MNRLRPTIKIFNPRRLAILIPVTPKPVMTMKCCKVYEQLLSTGANLALAVMDFSMVVCLADMLEFTLIPHSFNVTKSLRTKSCGQPEITVFHGVSSSFVRWL